MLTSVAFDQMIVDSLDKSVVSNFRLLMKTSTIIYNRRHQFTQLNDCSFDDLRTIRASSGQHLLQALEAKLRPQALAATSKDSIYALVTVIFGTILAASYVCSDGLLPTSAVNLPSPKLVVDLGFTSKRTQLIEILASYLVRLMERLNLLESSNQAYLVENAPKRWNKKGTFSWGIYGTCSICHVCFILKGNYGSYFPNPMWTPGTTCSQCRHHGWKLRNPTSSSLISTPTLGYTEVQTGDIFQMFDCCHAARVGSLKPNYRMEH